MTIGEAIKKARVKKGYSRTQLSQEAQIAFQTLYKWEIGETYPNIVSLILIADVLNISLDELVGRIEAKEEETPKFKEIQELYDYCIKNGVKAIIEPLLDGYAIRFKNGSDFVQHFASYGSDAGYVEPAIGCRLDYRAVSLLQAKALVKYYKDRLNKEVKNNEQKTAD